MAELLTADDIQDIQSAVAPALSDEEVSLIEVWRVPYTTPAQQAGGGGLDAYGQPIGDAPDPTLPNQQRAKIAQYPARISRAGIGGENGFPMQPVTVAPFTLTFNWADNPDIAGGDKLIVAKAKYGAAQTRIAWSASTLAVVGALMQPVTSNGRYYRAKIAGTTDTTEPDWPREPVGATVVDGTVTWEYVGKLRTFEVVDPGGATTYKITRLVRCEELIP